MGHSSQRHHEFDCVIHGRVLQTKLARGAVAVFLALVLMNASPSYAELDGHGPDAWRVVDVEPSKLLEARMGPGEQYPVIEAFSHNERGLQQVTCVPYFTFETFQKLSLEERDKLGERWCMMRDSSLTKAGWVPQKYLMEDASLPNEEESTQSYSDDDVLERAEALVRELYAMDERSMRVGGPHPLELDQAGKFFSQDLVATIEANQVDASPLYGAQDQDIKHLRISRDLDNPVFRGLVTINADFENFGHPQRAVFLLRADPSQPGAPLRIIRVEHDGWAFE